MKVQSFCCRSLYTRSIPTTWRPGAVTTLSSSAQVHWYTQCFKLHAIFDLQSCGFKVDLYENKLGVWSIPTCRMERFSAILYYIKCRCRFSAVGCLSKLTSLKSQLLQTHKFDSSAWILEVGHNQSPINTLSLLLLMMMAMIRRGNTFRLPSSATDAIPGALLVSLLNYRVIGAGPRWGISKSWWMVPTLLTSVS